MTSITAKEYRHTRKAKTRKSMARRAAKRDAVETESVKVLEQCGFSVFRLDEPCDLLCGFRGRSYLVEVKSGHKGYAKALNENQQTFSDQWRGSPLVTLHSAQEAIDWAVSIASQHEAEKVHHDNRVRDALDDFLDAYAEADRSGSRQQWLTVGALYSRYMKIRDGGPSS